MSSLRVNIAKIAALLEVQIADPDSMNYDGSSQTWLTIFLSKMRCVCRLIQATYLLYESGWKKIKKKKKSSKGKKEAAAVLVINIRASKLRHLATFIY